MEFTPYPPTLGQKFRNRRKLKKMNRPLAVIFKTNICECIRRFIDKRKISFLNQLFRQFYKDSLGFRMDGYFKKGAQCQFQEGDFLHLICHSTKAILRKFLLRLDCRLDDYKLLKRRKYTLFFSVYLTQHTMNENNKNIFLEIVCNNNDMFRFIVTINYLNYNIDLVQLLFFFMLEEVAIKY